MMNNSLIILVSIIVSSVTIIAIGGIVTILKYRNSNLKNSKR